jgi:Ca2+-binding RTX toxin-like protein
VIEVAAETSVSAETASDDDVLIGGPGNDLLMGGDGDDWLFGGELDETLLGLAMQRVGAMA